MRKTFKVTGMSCATCANSVNSVLEHTKGVEDVSVNVVNDTADVTFDENTIDTSGIIAAIESAGYGAFLLDDSLERVSLRVEGMTCATCVGNVEKTLSKLEGTENVTVSLASNKATLKYNPKKIRVSEMKKAVQEIGYDITLEEEIDDSEDPDVAKMRIAKKKMLSSAIIAAIVMTLMVVHMFIATVPFYTPIVAALGAPVVFYFGFHVHKGSFKSLKNLSPNMDVLVSLGSMPPYLIGLMGLFFPVTTFIEMATAIMTFHLIGKFLESRAKGKASQAIKKLVELGAKSARIVVDGEEIEVSTKELSQGDLMVIRPGEKIPTDGVIKEGSTTIDESLATGESMPVKKERGDEVIGATINKQGAIKAEVTKVGKDTFLSQVITLVEQAQGSKVPIQEFADRVTGYFVPIIMLLTLMTFGSFLLFTDFHQGIMGTMSFLPWVNPDQSPLILAFVTATAVLVIACPCALGLGTPTALMVGSGIGADKGILIRNGEAVQTLKDIKLVAFDKTGTLTLGEPVVTDLKTNTIDKTEFLQIAGSLEKGSEHTLAQAILKAANDEGLSMKTVHDFEALSGRGVKGTINDTTYYIGNRRLMDEQNIDYQSFEHIIESLENEAKTAMFLSDGDKILGVVAVSDALKKDAKAVIQSIENLGIKTAMITGDNERTANAIAKKAGISHVIAGVLPDGKVDEVKRLQDAHGLVAMIGDGINDAPALKQANVGIALGTGTDVAIEAADVTLIRDELSLILTSIELSRNIFRKIKENYFWAWFYNAVAIPFAMFGLLHPMIGAAAMSVSSLNVVYNSLRLRRKKMTAHMEVQYET